MTVQCRATVSRVCVPVPNRIAPFAYLAAIVSQPYRLYLKPHGWDSARLRYGTQTKRYGTRTERYANRRYGTQTERNGHEHTARTESVRLGMVSKSILIQYRFFMVHFQFLTYQQKLDAHESLVFHLEPFSRQANFIQLLQMRGKSLPGVLDIFWLNQHFRDAMFWFSSMFVVLIRREVVQAQPRQLLVVVK